MSNMIAYCGLDCAQCGAYKATVANDDDMRRATAKEWSAMFGAAVDPLSVNCLGCSSELLFSHCAECNIRACGVEKAVDNCAVCSDYGCSKNVEFLSMAPEAKENLEKIRKGL